MITVPPERAKSRISSYMSSLAPTSTPRVGSSQMRTRAERTSHRARIPFLLRSAAQRLHRLLNAENAHVEARCERTRGVVLLALVQDREPREHRQAGKRDVPCDRHVGHEALRLAVLRQKSYAKANCVARRLEAHGPSFESDRSAGRRPSAGQKTDQFRLPAADQPCNAEHLALIEVEVDILDLPFLRQSL